MCLLTSTCDAVSVVWTGAKARPYRRLLKVSTRTPTAPSPFARRRCQALPQGAHLAVTRVANQRVTLVWVSGMLSRRWDSLREVMTILFHLDLLLVAQLTERRAARLVEHPADLMPPYPPALSHPTGDRRPRSRLGPGADLAQERIVTPIFDIIPQRRRCGQREVTPAQGMGNVLAETALASQMPRIRRISRIPIFFLGAIPDTLGVTLRQRAADRDN